MSIADNIARIQERMAVAARRAGRPVESVALMAVTKTFPAERIREAYAAGQRLFGENRVQEFSAKYAGVRDLADAQFHMIGHLQSNKAAKALEVFTAVDSVDSLHLAEKLNAAAAGKGDKRVPVLIEVNLGGEESKSGAKPDSPEFEELLQHMGSLENIDVRGLMAIPPYTDDPEGARAFFRVLRQWCEKIAARDLAGIKMDVLSMGMSHDFEVAIEEGSTCVRLGTAIFGERLKN
jgi:hypothetical protein